MKISFGSASTIGIQSNPTDLSWNPPCPMAPRSDGLPNSKSEYESADALTICLSNNVIEQNFGMGSPLQFRATVKPVTIVIAFQLLDGVKKTMGECMGVSTDFRYAIIKFSINGGERILPLPLASIVPLNASLMIQDRDLTLRAAQVVLTDSPNAQFPKIAQKLDHERTKNKTGLAQLLQRIGLCH